MSLESLLATCADLFVARKQERYFCHCFPFHRVIFPAAQTEKFPLRISWQADETTETADPTEDCTTKDICIHHEITGRDIKLHLQVPHPNPLPLQTDFQCYSNSLSLKGKSQEKNMQDNFSAPEKFKLQRTIMDKRISLPSILHDA